MSPLLIAQHGRYKREYTKIVMRTAFIVFGRIGDRHLPTLRQTLHFSVKINFSVHQLMSIPTRGLNLRPHLTQYTKSEINLFKVSRKYRYDSRAWFRSTDLWVMGPARFHCATLLVLTSARLGLTTRFVLTCYVIQCTIQ